jgi:membrane-bound lytic murein transglycosylase MltF
MATEITDQPAVSAGAPHNDSSLSDEAQAVLYRPVERKTSDLDGKTRTIRVLVHYGRTKFFVANGRPYGAEYEAFAAYEKFVNESAGRKKRKINITFIPVKFEELIPSLLEGKGDIAAGFITVTDERKNKVAFADPYLENVSEVLVAHAGAKLPKSLEDLSGEKVHVLRGSSFAQHLRELNVRLADQGLRPVEIVEMPPSANVDDILEMVNAGIFDLTFADDHVANLWEHVLPDIRVVREVTIRKGVNIAWAVRPDNHEFLRSLNAFVAYSRRHLKHVNAQVMRRYFQDTKFLENPLKQELFGRVKQVGPFFKEAVGKNDLDWLMMLAQGYQESQLNQNLRSPRGALGIMQLLPGTAKGLGYHDITKSARNNIAAGVAYTDWIKKNYFNAQEISPGARVDFTLAAYNAGPERIQSLRREAKRRGLDPNVWFDNVERVALDKIGEEPVRYVANVNRYYIAYRMSEAIEQERDTLDTLSNRRERKHNDPPTKDR